VPSLKLYAINGKSAYDSKTILTNYLTTEARTAHYNGWNGENGMASNPWKPGV
jgi:hypothetical protein